MYSKIIFLLFISSISVFGQEDDDIMKIDLNYFSSNCLLDTGNNFIIIDKVNYDFKFSFNPSWVGALDDNFKMNLVRQIRIMINKNDSSQLSKFPIFLYRGINNKIKIESLVLTIYSVNNDKLTKTKIKGKEIITQRDSSSISLNLAGLVNSNNSIVEISYEILNLPKNNFVWILSNNYFVLKRHLLANIPEIYDYKIEYNITGNELKRSNIKETKGILIGYGSRGALMSEAFYKVMHKSQPEFKAPQVNCKYYVNNYFFENLEPKDESLSTDWIKFNLLGINPIE